MKPLKKVRVKVFKCDRPHDDQLKTGYKLKIVDECVDGDAESSNSSNDCEIENEFVVDKPASLLHLACAYADIHMMCYALALEADPNSVLDQDSAQYDNGSTPLIKAVHSVRSTHSAIFSSCFTFTEIFCFRAHWWPSSFYC